MPEPFSIAVASVVSFAASFVGTNTGGAGLITVPTFLLLGLPAQQAVAVSRLGFLGNSLAGFREFHRGGKIRYRIGIPIALSSSVGAFVGSTTLLATPSETMEKLIGVFLLVLLAFLCLRRDIGTVRRSPPGLFLSLLGYSFFFVSSFAAAFFGGGGGIIARYVLMAVFGLTYLESAGTRKIEGLTIALTSLPVYISSGAMAWSYGIPVFCAMVIGSHCGTRWGLRKGDAVVQKLFLGMVLLSALTLLL